jgi:hypothetical protein
LSPPSGGCFNAETAEDAELKKQSLRSLRALRLKEAA